MKRTYTTETRLLKGSEITKYLDMYVAVYNKLYREMWHDMTSPSFKELYSKESEYVTHMCGKYQLLKRTVDSLRNDINGQMRAFKELQKENKRSLKQKVSKQQTKVNKLIKEVKALKKKAGKNKATEKELEKLRQKKSSLYYQRNRLNKMKQRLAKIEANIDNGRYSIGFGSKKVFRKQFRLKENGYKTHEKWLNDYRKARDKNIYYLGTYSEKAGNQLCQLAYNEETGLFDICLRVEDKLLKLPYKQVKASGISIKYMGDEIASILKEKSRPLSYRFARRGNAWYMQVMFSIEKGSTDTRSKDGVIGIDYNEGFLAITETDGCGNLVGRDRYDLYFHGTGNKAKSEMSQVAARIAKEAHAKGKDIVIEDLDFTRTKSKMIPAKSKAGKKYNRQCHSFDYKRYKEFMQGACFKRDVGIHSVDPRNTSIIGKGKYAKQKKLTVHEAASYVIARRGQGFTDKVPA